MAAKRERSEGPVSAPVVSLAYEALMRGDDLSDEIEKAYGVDGLGILTVEGVPGLAEVRRSLLPLAAKFAALPEEIKSRYGSSLSGSNMTLFARKIRWAGAGRTS